ncbi:MAG: 50S ribosomal protein L4 [Gemmatimonadales bacterium]|nr:50S ribosomal protein L4 [Gemmatimonadales bacterium]
MIEAPHWSAAGERKGAAFALPADPFDGTVNEPVLHTAVRAYLNNQRQGTAMTKTRALVSGGNQKPWKQKGTGRARQGSIRAPHWVGGGTVFGPIPRSYTTTVPRKVRQLARRSALNARAREGAFHVIEALPLQAPKTQALAALLARLGLEGVKTLVLTAGLNRAAYLSGRNLPGVEVLPWGEASALDILRADVVVAEQAALTGEAPVAEAAEAAPAPAAKRTRKAAAPAAEGATAPKKAPARKPKAPKGDA